MIIIQTSWTGQKLTASLTSFIKYSLLEPICSRSPDSKTPIKCFPKAFP